jgi:hypothetical protein
MGSTHWVSYGPYMTPACVWAQHDRPIQPSLLVVIPITTLVLEARCRQGAVRENANERRCAHA